MGTTTSTDDDAYTAQREAFRANVIQRESGGQNIFSSAGDPNMPKEQKGSGYYQFIPSSWHEAANLAGIDTSQYPLAIKAPRALQDQAFDAYYAKYGERPWAQSAPGNARAQMASTDTSTADDTSTAPDPGVLTTPALAATPDQLRQALGLLGTSIGGGDKSQSAISKIGAALGGGQGNLSGADAESAGNRALINFGVGLLAQSGYHPVRTTMGEALAAGLQGAQASELGSQQLQRDTVQKALGYLQEQQGMGIKQGMLSVAQQTARIKQQELQIQLNKLRLAQGLPPIGASTAAATPPVTPPPPPVTTGVAPVASPDVQIGGPPPAPPGGSGASSSDVGIGAALQPPGGTPAAGPPAPDATIGKGSPIPAGKLLKSDAGTDNDQVVTDVAAMRRGQLLAQGGTPAGTVAAAGPAAGTPPTIGNYNNAPTTPSAVSVSPSSPAQPITPPTVAIPPSVAPKTGLAGYTEPSLPPSLQAASDGIAADEAKRDQLLEHARTAGLVDPAMSASYTAAAAALTAKIADARKQVSDFYQTDRNSFIEQQKAQQASDIKIREGAVTGPQQAAIARQNDALKGFETAAASDQGTLNQIDMVRQLSAAAGQPGLLSAPYLASVKDWLIRSNVASPGQIATWSAQQALDSAVNKLTLNLKQGSGMQRLTNMDLQFLQSVAPGSHFDPQQERDARLAFLSNAYDRSLKFNTLAHTYAQTMDPIAAQTKADSELKPIIQRAPRAGSPELQGASPDQWTYDNIESGHFYKDPAGNLRIMPDKTKFSRPPQ
jgi:hypothetical protein